MNTSQARPPRSCMIIAGETSGDMHAAPLVTAIRKAHPEYEFHGIGGALMRDAGVDTSYDISEMAVMGFAEVFRRLKFFKRVFGEMVDLAGRKRPEAVILVDYPGFNLRFAAKLHAMGITVIYYICPQVWAWHRERIPKMAAIVDKLITIFPFEAEHFKATGLDVGFAGHPLVDEARAVLARTPSPLPWADAPGVALLPGSREHEIDRLLPTMWEAATRLGRERPDLHFITAAPAKTQANLIRSRLSTLPAGPQHHTIVTGETREVLRQARAAMVASGTATIETALMRCPMVVTYKVAPLTYWLGRLLVKVPHIGMVNIVAGREICRELIQHDATPEAIAQAVTPLIDDSPERDQARVDLEDVVTRLGAGGAAARAAAMVIETMERKHES